MKPYLAIRRKTYRGQEGFLVYGSTTRGHHIRIFTLTRPSAEHIRAKVFRGEQTTVEDFQVTGG